MKKLAILSTTAAVFALSVLPTFAALDTGLSYGTFTGLGTNDIREGVMNVVNVLLGFLGIIAIIIILYGGFVWMTAGGNEEKVGQANRSLLYAAIGLLIAILARGVPSIVGSFVGQPITVC